MKMLFTLMFFVGSLFGASSSAFAFTSTSCANCMRVNICATKSDTVTAVASLNQKLRDKEAVFLTYFEEDDSLQIRKRRTISNIKAVSAVTLSGRTACQLVEGTVEQ